MTTGQIPDGYIIVFCPDVCVIFTLSQIYIDLTIIYPGIQLLYPLHPISYPNWYFRINYNFAYKVYVPMPWKVLFPY